SRVPDVARGQVVGPGDQAGQGVRAVGLAVCSPRHTALLVPRFDRRAAERGAAGVLHIPANAARAGLREGRRGGEGDEDETEEQPPAELRERWTAAHERVSCKRVCPRYHAPRAVCQVRVSPRRFSPPRFTFLPLINGIPMRIHDGCFTALVALGLDVIHGYRTIFPIPLAEAATWDPAAAESTARAAAREAAAAGVNWTFAPMVDIARDARWGRIAEGAGEDPYLGSAMAAARVRGFQGKDLRAPDAVLATVKHFAAYGGAEGGRDYNTVDLSERTLREIYLPPYRAGVDAGAGSIMTSFNEIGGIPSHASRWLVTTLLRDEWKFSGFVVSDWTGVGGRGPPRAARARPAPGNVAP